MAHIYVKVSKSVKKNNEDLNGSQTAGSDTRKKEHPNLQSQSCF